MFNTDEAKRALLPQREQVEIRRADLRGDKTQQYARVKGWIEDDPYEGFLQQAGERAKPLRKQWKDRVIEGCTKSLAQGLVEGRGFLNSARRELEAVRDEADRRAKERKQEANDLTQDLKDEVSALESAPVSGVRLRWRVTRLIETVNARNVKSWSAARNRKLAELTEELLELTADQSASLMELERKLASVQEALEQKLRKAQEELHRGGVFEESIGSVEDVRDELPAAVDFTGKLPAWLELSEQEILEDVTGELGRRVADGALNRSFIDRVSRRELEDHIASAHRLAAPYLRLKRESPGSRQQAFILTGYDGDRNVAAGVPEEVAQPRSDSFSRNEVLVLRVRIGARPEDIADRQEWRHWAKQFERIIPLHTLPFLKRDGEERDRDQGRERDRDGTVATSMESQNGQTDRGRIIIPGRE